MLNNMIVFNTDNPKTIVSELTLANIEHKLVSYRHNLAIAMWCNDDETFDKLLAMARKNTEQFDFLSVEEGLVALEYPNYSVSIGNITSEYTRKPLELILDGKPLYIA